MQKAVKFFPFVLLFFHLIGAGLFLYFSQAPQFSYITILLSALLVLLAEEKTYSALLVFGVIFISGFLIELVGVQTGLLFGSYIYQDAMGPLIFGTPIIIGATWYAVVAGSAAIAKKIKTNLLVQSLFAGMLAVIMDFFIEQVAMNYGLWFWENGTIPIYNYICWFIFGSIFSFIYMNTTVNHNNTARYLYWIWLGFFTVLTIFI